MNETQARAEICEIGRRIYARGFAAGTDGNISARLPRHRVLCTPSLICKGFMRPDDLCIVDLSGRQLRGDRPRTSEIHLHLAIYRGDPTAMAVVHCHPPHATAFGVAHEEIPTGILPEGEVFLGVVPRAPFATPGGPALGETVRPFIGRANSVVLSNHGTVSWGTSLERAYWWTEILDAYCRILLLAKLIGGVERIARPQVEELLDLRERFGMGVDPRRSSGGELYVNPNWGRPASRPASAKRRATSRRSAGGRRRRR
jgi:L-fuculose-phosphate aldolase